MTPIELIADSLTGNFHMLKFTLADFSDQEMLVRPVPAANHALWQLGHLAASERRFLTTVAGEQAAPPPADWADKFTKQTAGTDDAAAFPAKEQVLAYFEQVRNAVAAWVRTMTPADLEKPTGGPMAAFAPTYGHLALVLANHTSMHLGQFQVIRRKLGKAVLF